MEMGIRLVDIAMLFPRFGETTPSRILEVIRNTDKIDPTNGPPAATLPSDSPGSLSTAATPPTLSSSANSSAKTATPSVSSSGPSTPTPANSKPTTRASRPPTSRTASTFSVSRAASPQTTPSTCPGVTARLPRPVICSSGSLVRRASSRKGGLWRAMRI